MAQMTSQTLYQALWNSADILRSKMDASEYKNYLLGLIFYKYLSDRMVVYASDQLEEKTTDLDKAQQIYTDAYNDKDLHDDLISNVSDEFGYHIQPDLTFTALIDKIDHGTF
ncbi:type I restriction-modification system, M subunit [Lacticaseibacillus paracasei]|nr:type I restriction-modification system, M subunit [Lacticaseibacillus paracasei]